jgi:hypothetical protein
MFKLTSRLPLVAAALAAATVLTACGSSSPTSSGSDGPPTQAQLQREQRDAVRFADCMRSHGVPNFPDPTTSPHAFKSALSTNSPAVQSAATACQHLLPNGGRPNQSPARSQAQVAAMLAFARCIRSHGFPNFPDPTGAGELTREMIASAGINLHQPAVIQAGDACVSATHGVITRAIVARFVAGR